MKKLKNIILMIILIGITFSCDPTDEMGIENSTSGAYVKQISVTSDIFNPFDLSNAYFELTVEEWDGEQGDLLQSYDFSVRFTDNTPDEDDNIIERPITFVKSIPASSFSKDGTTGLPRATIRITAIETLAALGLNQSDVGPGDNFRFIEELKLTDGRVFNDDNSAVEVSTSTFYKSPFFHDVGTGKPLEVTLDWNGNSKFCGSVDLDLYLYDIDGNDVTNYAAATGNCPESFTAAVALPNGTYDLYVNPYAHSLAGSNEIPLNFTFSREGKDDITMDAGVVNSADPIWYDNDGVTKFIYLGSIVKNGLDFEILNADGDSQGTLRKGDIHFSIPQEVLKRK